MKEIKYKTQIDKLLKELLYEDWMNEEDYNEFLELVFKQTKISIEDLSDKIDYGVKKGHSVEFQIALLKKLIK